MIKAKDWNRLTKEQKMAFICSLVTEPSANICKFCGEKTTFLSHEICYDCKKRFEVGLE